MRKLTTVIGLVLMLALGLVATVGRPQPARAADGDNVVLVWNQIALQAIRDTRPLPTVAARALAVVHTATYDAWAAYEPVASAPGCSAVCVSLAASAPRPTRRRRSVLPPTPP